MQKIKRVRHVVAGIALSSAGFAAGGKSPQELNDFINKEILPDGYHAIQVTPLRSTVTESGDPAFIQNEYIFIEYEDEAEVRSVGRPRKATEDA